VFEERRAVDVQLKQHAAAAEASACTIKQLQVHFKRS